MSMPIDFTTLKVARQLEHAGMFFGLAQAPRSRRVFVGCSDTRVYHLDLAAEQPEWRELAGHDSYVTGVVHAGSTIVSGGWDGKLIWWDAESGALIRKVDAHGKWIRRLAATTDGRLIASVADDMLCKIWDAATGEPVRTLAGHDLQTPHHFPSMLYAAAFSPDGRYLATGDKIGHIIVWDVATGRQATTLEAPQMYTWDPAERRHSIGGIRSLAFSPDGQRLAVGGTGQIGNVDGLEAPGRVEIFDWQKGERIAEQTADKYKGLADRLAFSPQGDWLLAAGGAHDGFLMFVSTADGKLLHQDKAPTHLYDFELLESADGFVGCGHGKLVEYRWSVAPQ